MYLNDLTVYYQLTDDEDVLFLLKNVDQLDNKAIEHDFIAKFLQVAEKYDIKVNLCGGGFTGQSQALRLAIARALAKINPEDKKALRAEGFC